MSQYRIVKYCDGEQYAVEELVKGEWQYWPTLRQIHGKQEFTVADRTFATIEDARRAIEQRRAKEQARVIEEL